MALNPRPPLVALTQRVVVSEHGERRDALDQRWQALVAEIGALPLLLPNDTALALALVRDLEPMGVVLTGGNDLQGYGGDAPERDAMERALLEHSRRHELAIVGVCRGMQLMLHTSGAVLERVTGHVAARMQIRSEPGGRPRQVNSYHNWGIRELPENWRARAYSCDGVIKAVEHESRPWYGLMWHPEREAHPDPEDLSELRRRLKLD